MANTHVLFLEFVEVITPSSDEMQTMKTSRTALETKIVTKIDQKLGIKVKFYTQGSGAKKMKTIIKKIDGTYDADRGIYLLEDPKLNPETVQGYVYDAVNDHTADGAEHRKKCVRVFYKSAYNIDFPVYYQEDGDDTPRLAVKNNGWIKDAPRKMVDWLADKKDEDGQLVRIIKELKAWASKCSCKMPSGIALSVWTARNFSAIEDRDDECLLAVLKGIQNDVKYIVQCISPVEPYDDLVAKLSDDQKKKFKEELDEFVAGAEKAINEKNQLKSSKIWRKFFGDRFPEGVDEDTEAREAELLASANLVIAKKANLDRQGRITAAAGIAHKEHRNYGG